MKEIKKLLIIIPIYKKKIDIEEKISLKRLMKVLKRYPKCFITYKGMDISFYKKFFGEIDVAFFDEKFFSGICGYNHLMLSLDFYERFIQYSKILIYQLDAYIFSDRLNYFLKMNYDYIGAPWLKAISITKKIENISHTIKMPRYLYVGNGGFSLRDVSATLSLLRAYPKLVREWKNGKWNEDVFFSLCGNLNINRFKIAPIRVALKFSFETNPKLCFIKNNMRLPMGCHAWIRYDKSFFAHFIKMDK